VTGGTVWVLDQTAGTVTPVDAATGTVESPLRVGQSPTGIAAGLGAVWVTDGGPEGAIFRIDPTVKAVRTFDVGSPLGRLAIDGASGRLWVEVLPSS
jgi:streptogramin lyase